MYRVEQYGGMTLVGGLPEQRDLDRALRRMDPNLFLDPEFDPKRGTPFWTVKYHRGDQYPLLITDWREPDGSPKDLGWSIVDDLKRKEGLGWEVVEKVLRQNKELQERRDRETMEMYEEIQRDVLPRVMGPRRTVQVRGQSLRRMRDRQRARGENV